MSKLTDVRTALEGNPNIIIVGAPEQNYLPGRNGYWSHTVDFHVAPKDSVYTADKLQALMVSLVPDLETSAKDDFHEWDRELAFGKLYYDEDIGKESVRKEITLTDESMFGTEGFVDGSVVLEKTERVRRRTWVRVFPNIKIAEGALEGENEYRISKQDLHRSQGFAARIAGALSG